MLTTHEKIRQIRLGRNLSQGQMAHLLGYTPSSVSRIEQGVLKPSLKFLQRVADTFNVRLSYLLDSSEPFSPEKECHINLRVMEPGLRALALDTELCRQFEITEEEIQQLAMVRFRAGSVGKESYLSLLFFLRNVDRPR